MDKTIGSMKMNRLQCDAFGRQVDVILQAGVPPTDASAYRLLVPVDGSPASLEALSVAARIADSKASAVLHLLNAQVVLGVMHPETLQRQGLADTSEARSLLDKAGTPYFLHLLAGNAAAAIVARSRQLDVSEIVMGADGAGSITGELLGSTAMAVIREAEAPVTLAKSGSGTGQLPAEWFDWLVACDGSETAQRAVRHVLQQVPASGHGQRIHLLNVQAPDITPASLARDWQDWAAEECGEALRALDEAGIDHEFHVVSGDAAEKIIEVAHRAGCGHIAMGTRGLGWLQGLMLGSVSSGVLRRTALPVTLVK